MKTSKVKRGLLLLIRNKGACAYIDTCRNCPVKCRFPYKEFVSGKEDARRRYMKAIKKYRSMFGEEELFKEIL